MLIDNIELMDFPERIISSVIGPNRINYIFRLLCDPSCFSALVTLILSKIVSYREVDMTAARSIARTERKKFVGQVI